MEHELKRTISGDLFKDEMSKSQATQLRIIDGTIRCLVKFGLEKNHLSAYRESHPLQLRPGEALLP